MKKKILINIMIFLMGLFMMPTMNLAASKEPVNIYMFRGQGCGFCKKFLNYVNETLLEKYEGKINLVAYEVWYNEENSNLMKQVANFKGDNISGVPYIIIGDKSFLGYSEQYNTEIEAAIENLYNSNNRYDIFEKMGNKVDLSLNESKDVEQVFKDEGITFASLTNENTVSNYSKNNSDKDVISLMIWNIIITVVGVLIVVIISFKNKKDVLKEINELQKGFSKNKYKMKN